MHSILDQTLKAVLDAHHFKVVSGKSGFSHRPDHGIQAGTVPACRQHANSMNFSHFNSPIKALPDKATARKAKYTNLLIGKFGVADSYY
jgi:hypothetical protein